MTKFTKEQKQAIETLEGNLLVVASAGSGKTSVFTERIANLIKQGTLPHRILAVTFTKKASEEMRDRLSKLVGEETASQVVMGTFHSVAYRLLLHSYPYYRQKEFAKDWWILKTVFDICDEQSWKNPHGLGLGKGNKDTVLAYISEMKNRGLRPNERATGYNPILNDAYEKFEKLKNNANYITMTDLIVDFHEKLKTDEQFRLFVASLFDRIQIDEVQDTSDLVFNCIELINQTNVFVVGDWRQSIYSFIGANVDNILEFSDRFENTTTIELRDNFRSSKNIVEFSNGIIAKSPMESYKRFKPSKAFKGEGEEVTFRNYTTEEEETLSIVDQISDSIKKGCDPSEIAVLVRTNAQIGLFENVMNENNIPYDVSRGGSFFQYGEVVDIISYIKLAVNKKDNTSVRRVINRPSRFISNKLMSDLDIHAKANNMTLLEALRVHPSATQGYQAKNVQDFFYVVEQLTKLVNEGASPKEVVKMAISLTDYKQHIKNTSLEKEKADAKIENLNKLSKIASRYKDVRKMLLSIQEMEQRKEEKKKKGVQLMTVHASKGLEFDKVFVPSMVQEVFPHKKAIETLNVEEERRLYYVASSRARDFLQISTYKTKLDEESETVISVEPSEFIFELVD